MSELGGLGGGDGLAQHGVQLDDLLVLDAAHVRRVGVGAGAGDVAQLAAQRAAARAAQRARRGAGGRQLHGGLLLLVLLALQVLLVGLRAGARDAAHVAVVQLLRFGRRLGPARLPGAHAALVVVLPAAVGKPERLIIFFLPSLITFKVFFLLIFQIKNILRND